MERSNGSLGFYMDACFGPGLLRILSMLAIASFFVVLTIENIPCGIKRDTS